MGVAIEIGPFTIHWYAILINLGIVFAIVLARAQAKSQGLNPDTAYDITLVALPIGIIGARLWYVAFNLPYYLDNPGQIFQPWLGGLAIHGGLIFGILAGYIYTKIKKIDFLSWADIAAPGIAIAQAVGRWGNYINQEAYGYETNLPWAIFVDGAYRHPTFLYESIWNIILASILIYILRSKRKYKGQIIILYGIGYSIGRFWIEGLRTDSLMLGSLRVAQLVSIVTIVFSIYIANKLKVEKESEE